MDAKEYAHKSVYSMQTALLAVTEVSHKARKNSASCVILLELSRSSLLLLYPWCSSYLQDQPYHVAQRASGLSFHSLTTGVSQGSVLAPLLFSLYTKLQGFDIRSHSFSYATTYFLLPPKLPRMYWTAFWHLFLDKNLSTLKKTPNWYWWTTALCWTWRWP